ncbi:glycosyltransferase [Sediminicoccus sp. KRV36]|uniref:glycosyltransferase n=1 Tax=Sediminicoccus sp. KRV36 TaxID=3133721 RepID=UPI00200EC721|nr:glycosyltransferase [Sediminicoccus rosea]UPY34976.1 glycosyltransferase [Sediminicoccus rosea]
MRGHPERILVIIPSPVLGGAEAQTLQIARGFAAMGAEVAIAAEPQVLAGAALGPALPLAASLRPPEGLSPEAAHRYQASALQPLFKPWRPDAALVCCPLPTEAFGALLALTEAGIPALAVAHLVRQDWELAQAERAALPRIQASWAAVSDASARRLEALFGLPPQRVAAIPNGLPPLPRLAADPGRFGLPAGVRLLVQIGRLDHRKGAHLARQIAAGIAPTQLVLAGDGPLRGELHGTPGLHLLGQTDQVPALLAAADGFLLASEHEGCPLSVLEAARAGCPILATRQALEAWPDGAAMARIIHRDPLDIAAAFAESLRDTAGTHARRQRAAEIAAAWDEAAMLRRTAWLLAAASCN